jgi:ribosomal protein S27AE
MPEQIKVVTLKCANCGASLQVGTSVNDLACGYCGSHQQVIREGGSISLEKFADSLASVGRSADRAAAELAIPRLTREIEQERQQRTSVAAEGEAKIKAIDEGSDVILGGVFLVALLIGVVLVYGASANFNILIVICGVALAGAAFILIYIKPRRAKIVDQEHRKMESALVEIDSRIEAIERSLQENTRIANSSR